MQVILKVQLMFGKNDTAVGWASEGLEWDSGMVYNSKHRGGEKILLEDEKVKNPKRIVKENLER